jgi:hypothetical protein
MTARAPTPSNVLFLQRRRQGLTVNGMDVSRFAYRFSMRVAMAAAWLNAACAADPGDPLKTLDDGGPGRSADLRAGGRGRRRRRPWNR